MSFLKKVVNVRKDEAPLVFLMFSYFFIVISTFWILKPIKKAVFVGYYGKPKDPTWTGGFFGLTGPEAEQIAKVGNMVVAFVAVVAFTILSRKYHRHQLTVIFAGFSIAALGCFSFVVGSPGDFTAWSFYLFGDLFNTLMVATFFVFLNDSVKPADSKRLFGPIVLGGVAGGAVGSTFLAVLVDDLSKPQWMWVCIGTNVLIALIAVAAGKIVDRNKASEPAPEAKPDAKTAPPATDGNPAVAGAKLVFKSKYLLSIVAIVALYEIVSTILDFQFTSTIFNHVFDEADPKLNKAAADQQLATAFAITNWAGLGIQLLLTTFIMQRLGIKIALSIMPVMILLNSTAYLAIPVLWVGSFLNTSDNALNYSLNQSAREALWTPTSREEKYKAKAFIDMFVVRFAKAIAVGLNLLIASMFTGIEGIRWLSIAVIVLVAVWLLAARYAGKQYEGMTRPKD